MPDGLAYGLSAALAWGLTDICAALASRRMGGLATVAIVQATSLGGLTVVLAVVLLGETLLPNQAIGAGLATIGILTIGLRSDGHWRTTRFVGRGSRPPAAAGPRVRRGRRPPRRDRLHRVCDRSPALARLARRAVELVRARRWPSSSPSRSSATGCGRFSGVGWPSSPSALGSSGCADGRETGLNSRTDVLSCRSHDHPRSGMSRPPWRPSRHAGVRQLRAGWEGLSARCSGPWRPRRWRTRGTRLTSPVARRRSDRPDRVCRTRRDPRAGRPATRGERRRPGRSDERQDHPCLPARGRGSGERLDRRVSRPRPELRSRGGGRPGDPPRMARRPHARLDRRRPGDGRCAHPGSGDRPPAHRPPGRSWPHGRRVGSSRGPARADR